MNFTARATKPGRVVWSTGIGWTDTTRVGEPHAPGGWNINTYIKGIEVETGLTVNQVLREALDPVHHPRLVSLSGPSFAREIALRKPTVVTVASREEAYAISVQASLSCPWFRCYSNTDVTGVELGGALKNVIAIAVGMSDGLEQGDNARAALPQSKRDLTTGHPVIWISDQSINTKKLSRWNKSVTKNFHKVFYDGLTSSEEYVHKVTKNLPEKLARELFVKGIIAHDPQKILPVKSKAIVYLGENEKDRL